MSTPIVGDLFANIFGLIGKFVPDADKRAELAAKVEELRGQVEIASLQSKTTPKVDAAVKLMYAINDMIKENYRPLGAAFVFMWGLLHPEAVKDLHAMGAVGDMAVGSMFGSFPGWMYSRHKILTNGNGHANDSDK